MFSSQLPFLEPISLLFQALSRGALLAAAPEEGLVIPSPERLLSCLSPWTLPACGNQGCPPILWGAEARESGRGAKASQGSRSLQESKEVGATWSQGLFWQEARAARDPPVHKPALLALSLL